MSNTHHHDDRQLCMAFAMPDIELDSLYLREYWQQAVECVGASDITDAVCQTYRNTDSIAKTATILNFSYTTVRNKLHALNEPVKGPGGNNNPWGCKGKPRRKSELLPFV